MSLLSVHQIWTYSQRDTRCRVRYAVILQLMGTKEATIPKCLSDNMVIYNPLLDAWFYQNASRSHRFVRVQYSTNTPYL